MDAIRVRLKKNDIQIGLKVMNKKLNTFSTTCALG